MTLYEPKWSAPGDGTNAEPGEYEAWLEFKALVEAGHLVPVEPDYEAMAKRMPELIDIAAFWTENNCIGLAHQLWAAGIGETP